MAEELIKIPTTLNIEDFSGASITTLSSYVENGIIDEYPEGEFFVTQRPGFNTLGDASAVPVAAKGRGIYYWRNADELFLVNDTTVYYGSYSNACTITIASGYNRVWFAECANTLVMIDPQGNEGYTITNASPPVVAAMADGDFPNASETLADGVVNLDGYIFVLSNTSNGDARVWNSGLNAPTTWGATDFITAAKMKDRGVCITRHFDNIVVFGNESIEFFFNAGLPTGSPLATRDDISFNIGCADGKSVLTDNDITYFVGKSASGGMGVYKLENFQLEKISNGSMDSYLTTAIALSGNSVVASGFFTGGRLFYILTLYEVVGSVITPSETMVYNAQSKSWTFWEHSASDISQFPLIGWVSATNSNTTGKGMLSNGDYIESLDYFYPSDNSAGTGSFVASGFVASGFVTDVAASGSEITMKVRIGHVDLGTRKRKFMKSLRIVADETENSASVSVQYADDKHSGFSTARTIDLNNSENKLTRLGQFRSRTFDLTYTGAEQIRLQSLEVEVDKSSV